MWCILKGDNIQSGVVGFGDTKEDALANFIKDVPIPQEWSEEDDMLMDELESYILYDKEFNDEQKSWRIKRLKSLRPQPKQNVNDMITPNKKFFQWIYNRLVYVHNENPNVDYMISFKKRIEELSFDKPSWKPSEEQMEALNALNLHGDLSYVGQQNQLISLYQDLKKLM